MQQEKDRASREAFHWLIALHEDEDDEQLLARFDLWLSYDANNRQAWAECQHVWDTLGAVEDMPGTSVPHSAARHSTTTPPTHTASKVWRSPKHALMACLAAAAVICFVIVAQPSISLWLTADYSTGVAQTQEIKLDDGSIVYLGADSAVSVSLGTRSRSVALLAGEAFFEVAPDPSRPFSVETDNVETRVLGTGFNVRRSGAGVNVAVRHGSVAVSSEDAVDSLNTPLTAGDWVNVAWDGKVERGKGIPKLAGSWRSGMLVVKDRPVAEVIDEIRRHYNGTIVSADGQLSDLRVTGVYDLKRPLEALAALVGAHGANVHSVTPWVRVVSRW
jgi:transmembrane sensor